MNDKQNELTKSEHADIVECQCKCHTNPSWFHIMPCCEGQCQRCGKWFMIGLDEHILFCHRSQIKNHIPSENMVG